MKKTLLKLTVLTFAALAALVFTACEGPAGPTGSAGTPGDPGTPGADGTGFIPGTLTISGSPMVNSPVIAVYDNPENSPTITYRWYADGDYTASIGSSATYTPVAANVGKTLTCRVWALGFTGYKEGSAGDVFAFPPPSPVVLASSGTPQSGTISAASDVFWYSFTASAGNLYTIQVDDILHSGTSQTGNVSVSAYRSDGTALFTNASDTVDYPRDILGASGTLYIKVAPYGSADSNFGTYTVQFDTVTPAALTSGTPQSGTIGAASDVFWYSFTASAGNVYTIKVDDILHSGTSQTGNVSVSAYRSDGTALFTNASNTVDVPRSVIGVSGTTGTIYIKVVPYNSSNASFGTYTVQFDTAAFPTPTALTDTFVQYTLSTASQVDWYSFTPSSGFEVLVWEEVADIVVSAYQSDGTVIFERDDGTPSVAVGNAGLPVYVRVGPFSTGTGTYKIKYQ